MSIPGWVECSTIGVRDDCASPGALIYFNSYYPPAGTANPPGDTWTTFDVTTKGVPMDAKAVFLAGILIITHGTIRQPADLQICLRALGNTQPTGNYIGQTVEMEAENGQRSNFASWVPVCNGKLQFWWKGSTSGAWPTSCAYGTSLHIQAYARQGCRGGLDLPPPNPVPEGL